MTFVPNPSAAFILDVERFPTGELPLATTPLAGNELMTLLQGGRNVYITVSDFIALYVGTTWIYKTTDYTAVATNNIFVDTSGGSVTINLPSAVNLGDTVRFVDYAGTWQSNPLIVARNGNTIMGLAEDMTADIARGAFTLVYSGNTWRLA